MNSEPVSNMAQTTTRNVFLVAFFAALLVFTPIKLALSQTVQTIAFLDLGKILGKSLAIHDIDRQLKTIEAEIRADRDARGKMLRDEQDSLNRQRVILAPAVFEKKMKAFNARAHGFRNEIQSKLKQLSLSRTAAVNKVEKAMEPIVSRIAKSVGATMILEKKQILFGEKTLDISDMIIKDLNGALTKVTVTLVPLTEN